MKRPAGGRAPWSNGDLVRLVAVVAAGAVLCAVAWTGASGHAELKDQTGWVAVGVTGFLLAVAGQGLWLLRGRRAAHAHATLVMAAAAALAPSGAGPVAVGDRADRLVAADGLRHFHRAGCPIAAGRHWPPVTRAVHEAAGRTACGICQP